MKYLLAFVLFTILVFGSSYVSAQLTPEQSWQAFEGQRNQRLNDYLLQQQRTQSSIANPSLIAILGLIESNPESFASLGLVDLQNTELNTLRNEYGDRVAEINANPDLTERQKRSKINSVRYAIAEKVAEVLLPEQLEQIHNFDPDHAGLPKILVNTAVGKALKLTDAQKKRIQEKSDELAKRTEQLLTELRQEAANIIVDELDDDQRDSLMQFYSEKKLKRHFEQMPIGSIFAFHLFDCPEGVRESHLKSYLHRTELEFENISDDAKTKR